MRSVFTGGWGVGKMSETWVQICQVQVEERVGDKYCCRERKRMARGTLMKAYSPRTVQKECVC